MQVGATAVRLTGRVDDDPLFGSSDYADKLALTLRGATTDAGSLRKFPGECAGDRACPPLVNASGVFDVVHLVVFLFGEAGSAALLAGGRLLLFLFVAGPARQHVLSEADA
jgi:hypothetical protein